MTRLEKERIKKNLEPTIRLLSMPELVNALDVAHRTIEYYEIRIELLRERIQLLKDTAIDTKSRQYKD
jgi:hypothetical protein